MELKDSPVWKSCALDKFVYYKVKNEQGQAQSSIYKCTKNATEILVISAGRAPNLFLCVKFFSFFFKF